jgi:hypothetical protein
MEIIINLCVKKKLLIVMPEVHDLLMVGHCGEKIIRELLRKTFNWP